MIISITTTMKRLNTILVFLLVIGFGMQYTQAQSNEVLAKSYFLKAQKAYDNGNNATSLEYLGKTENALGETNPKIEALYIKTYMKQKDYTNAEKHLNAYFETADEEHSDYMEMLENVALIKDKVLAEKAKEAEKKEKARLAAKKLSNMVRDDVQAYFRNNNELCCESPTDRMSREMDWDSALGALQQVYQKSVDGSSIKNDTLYRSLSNTKMPLIAFKNMNMKVYVAKPNTFSKTSTTLTATDIYGNSIKSVIPGRMNPTFVDNVERVLYKTARQKRIIRYVRENPNEFPEKMHLLNLQSYLFAYGGRTEYDKDFPNGKTELEEQASENSTAQSINNTAKTFQAVEEMLTSNESIRSNWRSLKQNGYSIQFPKDWSVDDSGVQNSEFILSSPESNGAIIRMEVGNSDDKITLDNYGETFVSGYLKKNYNDVRILKDEIKNQNGYKFKRLISSLKTENNMEYIFWSDIIVYNKKLYVFLSISEFSQFKNHQPTVEKVLSSFAFN
ncbi:hypothetical protein O4H26_08330 [Aequorivita viscosa]|nr:hypothetical protein [Aequorivita viscosa]